MIKRIKRIMAIIKTGHRGWNHSGVKVHDNTAAPADWTELDLSSIVGKNRALVFVKVKNRAAAGIEYLYVRSNGETEETGATLPNPGMNSWGSISGGRIVHFAMETDADGIIEWKLSSDKNVDIWILGYIR